MTTKPIETDAIVAAAQEDIGLAIYELFKDSDTKFLLAESIIASVVTALIVEYLKGLLRPKEAGEARNASLKDWLARIKGPQPPSPEELREELTRMLANHNAGSASVPEAEAIAAFRKTLEELGVSSTAAEEVANAVAATTAQR